jgi:hypothetical protein
MMRCSRKNMGLQRGGGELFEDVFLEVQLSPPPSQLKVYVYLGSEVLVLELYILIN